MRKWEKWKKTQEGQRPRRQVFLWALCGYGEQMGCCPVPSAPYLGQWLQSELGKKKPFHLLQTFQFPSVWTLPISPRCCWWDEKWKDEVTGVIFLKQLCSVRSTQPFFLPPCCPHKYHGAINNLFHYKKWSSITEGLINPQGIDSRSEKAILIFPGRCSTQCFRMRSCSEGGAVSALFNAVFLVNCISICRLPDGGRVYVNRFFSALRSRDLALCSAWATMYDGIFVK